MNYYCRCSHAAVNHGLHYYVYSSVDVLFHDCITNERLLLFFRITSFLVLSACFLDFCLLLFLVEQL